MTSLFISQLLLGVRVGLHHPVIRHSWLFAALALSVAIMGASFSLRQTLVVFVDLSFSLLRLYLAGVALALVHELFVQDIQRKSVVIPFLWASSRSIYLAGRLGAIMLLLMVALLIFAVIGAMIFPFADLGYGGSSKVLLGAELVLVLSAVLLESFVIASLLTAIAMLVTSPVIFFFAGLVSIWNARLLGPMIEYLSVSPDADQDIAFQHLPILETLRWVIPDLSRLDWREIVLYGQHRPSSEYLVTLLMAIGFFLLYAFVASKVLDRREVS